MHYLLYYEVGDTGTLPGAPSSGKHTWKKRGRRARGELVLGGALANPVDSAVLLFKGQSPAVAEDFARTDPYVTGGTVKHWHVREWTTVVGKGACTPVRPKIDFADNEPNRQIMARNRK